jgi:hypothetical protein
MSAGSWEKPGTIKAISKKKVRRMRFVKDMFEDISYKL